MFHFTYKVAERHNTQYCMERCLVVVTLRCIPNNAKLESEKIIKSYGHGKGDLVADSHGIVARWMNYFSQLFNVHEVKDVGKAEIHTAEPLLPEPSASEVELAIDKLKITNRQVLIKYRQHLLQQGVEQFAWRFMNLLLLYGRRRNCLKSGSSRS